MYICVDIDIYFKYKVYFLALFKMSNHVNNIYTNLHTTIATLS